MILIKNQYLKIFLRIYQIVFIQILICTTDKVHYLKFFDNFKFNLIIFV